MKREQVLPHVMADMAARIAKGADQYGEPLTTNNGRDALQDAYEEALDLAMYLKQELMQRAQIAIIRLPDPDPVVAWPGPDWSQAPEWATYYIEFPEYGIWLECQPKIYEGGIGPGVTYGPGRQLRCQAYGSPGHWRDSLRKRPA